MRANQQGFVGSPAMSVLWIDNSSLSHTHTHARTHAHTHTHTHTHAHTYTHTTLYMGADLLELSFTDSVSVEDDAVRLEPCTLVEVDEHLPHHGRQLCDDLLAMVLHPHSGRVAAGVGVHTGHQLGRDEDV